MSTSSLVLELDLTGKSPANFIQAEQHAIGVGANRLIVPVFGAFFKEGLVLKDGSSFLPIESSKYLLLDFDAKASMQTGKEVFASIVVTDPAVVSDIALDYQAVGGPAARNSSGLIQLLQTRTSTGGAMDWDLVTDKLSKYPPAQHKMLLAHIYGMEYIVAGVDRLKDAIATGSSPVYDRTNANIETLLAGLPAIGNAAATEVIDNNINGTKLTINPGSFGLDMLTNLATMPKPIAEGAASIGFIFDPSASDYYSTIHSLDAFADKLRSEVVDANQTSLGLSSGKYADSQRGTLLALPNGASFLLRSKKSYTEAGVTYDPGVYPEGTVETDEFVILRINNAQNSAAGVFMLFNRMQHATYIGTLKNDNCASKLIWKKMFHDGELDELSKLLQQHAEDTKNPHELVAADVGFDKLENLPVVTTDEIDKQVGVRKYLTTDTLQYYMKMFMTNVKPPPSPNPTPDPNTPTMDQAQIVFTQCRVPPPDPVYPPKDQFVKSFCDGTDKFGTFTDGAGSTYDKVIELNSDDCKYKGYPAIDTLITKYCEGETEYGKFADGIGGTVDRKIRENSPECGGVATKTGVPSEGTPLGSYCKDGDKYSRYADGKGAFYEMLSEKFSKDCNLSANATIVFSKAAEVTMGGTDTTSANLAGFTPDSTYSMEVYTQAPNISSGEPFKTTTVEVTIDSTGKGSWTNTATDQGIVPRGTTTNWAYIPALSLKSNVVTTVYKNANGTTPAPTPSPTPSPTGSPPGNDNIVITLTKPSIVTIGDNDDTAAVFTGFTPNSTIQMEGYMQGANFNGGEPYKTITAAVNINSSGRGTWSNHSVDQGVVPRGSFNNWVSVPSVNKISNVINTQYRPGSVSPPSLPIPNPRVGITLDGNGNNPTIKVFTNVTVVITFNGFPGVAYDPRNATTVYYLQISGNDPRNVGPFEINLSNGSGSTSFQSTLLNNETIRGMVYYRIRAEWYSDDGKQQSAYSNTVSANWIDP